jgi:voltage-gated potassium channel
MTTETKAKRIRWGYQSEDGQVMLSLAWEIFVLGAAVLSIVNLFLAVLVRDANIVQVVLIVDSILAIVFLIDFLRRVNVATDIRAYVVHGYGWLDLVSIVPMLRIARILRIARVIRVLQRMGGVRPAFRAFFASRATGGMLLVMLIALLVLEFGAMAMLWAEGSTPDASITTGQDAVWYLIVTMSTVGYGDLYPVTDLGRLIGSVIIVVGVGVFGTLTGFLANAFMAPSDAGSDEASESVEDMPDGEPEGVGAAS